MKKNGYKIRVTARNKDVLFDLLKLYDLPYFNMGSGGRGVLGKIFYFTGKEDYFSDSLASFQNSESDFFFQMNFFPKRTFSANGDLQYNPKNKDIRRGNISLRYSSKDGKIFNLEHSHRKIEKRYSENIEIDELKRNE